MDIYDKYIDTVFDNRYKIENIIGVGGMAVVYRATDMLMNRVVAVKVLKDEIASDTASVKRFINESKAVSMLSHPNIVNIFDVSVRDDVKYIVMEYIEGITLKNYMTRKGALPLKEMISYSEQILRALSHAHAKGIVHRDIKPQNIMLLKNGLIKVMDFGIAKLPNAETVTMTDKAIGTVYYISPEQASGQPIDARSDIYSLGVMMYEMSTGRLPFTADSPVSVALMQINDTPVSPREINGQIPQGLEQIIISAMEKEPERRYQSASDMLSKLIKVKENPNIIFRSELIRKKEEEKIELRKKKKKFLPMRDSHSMFPIILGVISSFMIVACVCGYFVLSSILTKTTETKTETITVVNLVGSIYTNEMNSFFQTSDTYSVKLIYEYNPSVENGYIISQDPVAGSKKKITAGENKCELTLTISKGAETVVLPDLTVNDYREVEIMVRDMGLIYKEQRVSHATIPMGYVVSTSPAAGETLRLNDTVIVYVSTGPEAGTVMVPNFKGYSESSVFAELIELGLRPGKVTSEYSDYPEGVVISQNIAAYTIVASHTKIDLVISLGPKPTPPDTSTDDSTGESESESGSETTPPDTSGDESDESSAESSDESTSESESGETSESESATEIPPESNSDDSSEASESESDVDTGEGDATESSDEVAPSDPQSDSNKRRSYGKNNAR